MNISPKKNNPAAYEKIFYLLVIMEVKTAIKYYYTPTRMAKVKRQNTKC